jgi:hypothetical protein
MFPGEHFAVGTALVVLVGTDGTRVMEVNISDDLALDISVQSVHNGSEYRAFGIEFENRMGDEVLIDEDGRTNILDKVTTATTVVLSSFTEYGVGSFGEAIEVEVPELIFVQIDFEQIVGAQDSVEVVNHASLHILESHILFSFQMTTFMMFL